MRPDALGHGRRRDQGGAAPEGGRYTLLPPPRRRGRIRSLHDDEPGQARDRPRLPHRGRAQSRREADRGSRRRDRELSRRHDGADRTRVGGAPTIESAPRLLPDHRIRTHRTSLGQGGLRSDRAGVLGAHECDGRGPRAGPREGRGAGDGHHRRHSRGLWRGLGPPGARTDRNRPAGRHLAAGSRDHAELLAERDRPRDRGVARRTRQRPPADRTLPELRDLGRVDQRRVPPTRERGPG